MYLIVVVGDRRIPLGVNHHWNSHKPRPGGSADNLRIDLRSPVAVSAGMQNHRNERNVVADADFTITIFMTDVSGKADELTITSPDQRYSTDGRGLGASDIKAVLSVQRYDFR